MKLLIATGLYPPEIGGPATYTVFLEKRLKEYDISYITIPFTRVRAYPRIIRHIIYTVHLIRQARSCDFLYALDAVSVGVPVYIASIVTRTPYLVRIPGDYAWEQGQQRFGVSVTLDEFVPSHSSIVVRVLSAVQTFVTSHARHVIVPSDYLKRIVETWGISGNRITRVYSTLKTIKVSESKETARELLGFGGFALVTAGRLVPWKGFQLLIEMTATLRREGVPVSLHVLGDGVMRKDLEVLARELRVDDVVYFYGNLPRDEMAKYIVAGDVFVLNTSYEGLSHQLIEVMSLKTPIITTNVGGNPELITHEKTGLLIPYNNVAKLKEALYRVYRSPDIRDAWVSTAFERTRLFHEDVAIEEFVRLLKKV